MIEPNPFTPKSGEEPKLFLNREDELSFFRKRLNEALRGKLNHYVVTGDWGIGKTSLMKYLKTIAQKEGYLSVYFPASEFKKSTSLRDLSLHLIRSISKNLPIGLEEKSNFLKRIKGCGLQILGTGFNIELETQKETFIEPQLLLIESLLGIWEDIKVKTPLTVILIDDVQNYQEVPEIFTLLKNVLSMDEILKNTKFLFVLSSTLDGWERFLIKNHPIGRYFIPRRELKYFTKEDTKNLVIETLKGTGVDFSDEIISRIYEHTEGHLFEIHSLCSALYDSQLKGKVEETEWIIGYRKGLSYLGKVIFENRLRFASEREKEALFILSHFNESTTLETLEKKAKELKIDFSDLDRYYRRLVEKKLIERPARGQFLLRDGLFRGYVMVELS